MDRRSVVSAAALLGFVLMLVGTSKPRPTSGPVPAPMPTAVDAGVAEIEDAGAAELPSDGSGPIARGDAGRLAKAPDGGLAPPVSMPAGRLQLPAPWDDVGVPAGGKIDAIRLVHRGADVSDIQAQYVAAFTAKGWSVAPGESARVTTFSRRGQRLVMRLTPEDDEVIVSLNLL